jgi:hypothetical protein
MDPLLLGTAAAFGLAASAGLNTTLPLLIVAVLARLGLLELAAPFDALASDLTIGGLAFFALLEFVGDKIPGLDSIVETIQWPLAAAAGAILFASQTSAISSVSPEIAILTGVLTAGTVHAARTAARPAFTGLTLGIANPIVSIVEDGFAVALIGASLISPALTIVLLAVLLVVMGLFIWLGVRSGIRISRWLKARPRTTS